MVINKDQTGNEGYVISKPYYLVMAVEWVLWQKATEIKIKETEI